MFWGKIPPASTPMKLTATAVRNAKPKEKPYKLGDGGGMFLLVNPNGSKYWRLKYRILGKEKLLALGVYPDVSLSEARQGRDEARKLLANDTDPSEFKKVSKQKQLLNSENSFESITREWHKKQSNTWSEGYSKKILDRFEKEVFPHIGNKPISDVNAPVLLAVLRRIESRGVIDTAHRIHQNCGQVFRYAVATGRAERDPSVDLRGALTPVNLKHHASITDPVKVGCLLRAIDGYDGFYAIKSALRLAPLLFVRPGELRHAEWSEVDLVKAEWRIPAEKMKMKELHIVPLSVQALAILEELQPLTGNGQYLFPSIRTNRKPISENTINSALRKLGYTKEEMTGHGFRSMASTLLNEQGFNKDWIERQLAHAERDNVRAAYNYAEYLPERKKMMQQWADYLDSLRNEKKVVTGIFNQTG